MLAAVQRAKVTTQMTFQNRFFPSSLCARRLVERGEIGEILGFRVAYLHGGSADPKAPLRWKLSAEAGGGVIADLASHVFDFAEYLVGLIARLMATTHIAYPRRPSNSDPAVEVEVSAEDSVVMLAQLPSGATGTLEATKIATGSEDELRCEVHGSKGALRFNLMDPHHLEFYQMGERLRPVERVAGPALIRASVIRDLQPVFPAQRPPSVGCVPTWHVWRISCKPFPMAARRTPICCRGSASNDSWKLLGVLQPSSGGSMSVHNAGRSFCSTGEISIDYIISMTPRM